MSVTAAELSALCPTATPALVDAIVSGWGKAEDAGIDTPIRIRHFLARIAVETGGLRAVEESLTYTSVERLRAVWPSRFKSDSAAKPFVRNPKALAIKVYGGRLGNAPDPSTDGWDYRGGGMMQTTGRDNYRRMGFEANPENLRDPDIAFETAVHEWDRRGCNAMADRNDVVAVCKAINGGLTGLEDQRTYLRKGEGIWPDVEQAPVPRPREDRPGNAPAQTPAPTPTPAYDMAAIQRRLYDLGYTEVGNPNGVPGKMTKTAILAFRHEHDLPLSTEVDQQFLDALMSAEPRVMAPERSEAKEGELKNTLPEVSASWWGKIWAYILGIPAAITAAVGGASDSLPDAKRAVDGIKPYLPEVPLWGWGLLTLLAAVIIWNMFHKASKASVENYRSGARR